MSRRTTGGASRRTLAGVVAGAALVACTSAPRPVTTPPSAPAAAPSSPAAASVRPSPSPSPPPSSTPVADSSRPAPAPGAPAALPCPPSYAAPDADRPVLSAALQVEGRTVTGTSRVVFTPDLPVDRLVFRLWAAGPRSRAAGASIEVSSVAVDGAPVTAERPAPTLLRLPLTAGRPAGTPITVDLAFRLRLPTGTSDRLGARGETSWFGSGLPLLAWERGRGWAEEPETARFAEAAASEVMNLRSLAVTRPPGLAVIATGTQSSDDGRTAVFSAPAVRDVVVATGRFRTAAVTAAGGTPVTVGVAPGLPDDPAAVARELARALEVHARRFGPFPYAELSTAVVPDLTGGVEYPAALLLGTGQAQDATGSHEVAHEWWYGLVGGNQARDPWLDEAFATYAEALDRGTAAQHAARTVPADGRRRVGAPMTYWEGRRSYFRSVYDQGATMLAQARARAGAAAFDEALVCHARRNAHRLTTPEDVAASLRHLPAAVQVLQEYGALPR
jgi:hypothetical protein